MHRLPQRKLIAKGGGMTAVKDGVVLNTLRLEVGGLMTRLNAEELTKEAARMKEVERGLGLTAQENPLFFALFPGASGYS